ncbi:MAG: hypothetical protein Q9M35_00130 [Rhodothermus sp.]|nr:hypothetical protein [Rhodothermus sp.]
MATTPDGKRDGRIALVYLGSPTCGPSNDPELLDLLNRIRKELPKKARAQGLAFRMVGVAISRNVRMGLDHLRKMGPFHEVATGARWYSLPMHYLQTVAPGIRATPQVVLLHQDGMRVHFLLRQVGVQAIRRWVAAGMPLPDRKYAQESLISDCAGKVPWLC